VVFLVRSFGFPEGMAATNRVRLLARALTGLGADVSVICARVSERPDEVRNPSAKGLVDGIAFLYTPGTTTRSHSFVVRRIREFRGYVLAIVELGRRKAEGRLDCVFLADGGCEGWHPSVSLLLIWLRLLGVPVITELNEYPRMQPWLPNWLSRHLSYLAGVDGAVAISGWLARWAAREAQRIGRRVDVVEIPIVVDACEGGDFLPVHEPSSSFVYAASNEYSDDLAFVFCAMHRVWCRYPEACLTVTGMRAERALEVARRESVVDAVEKGSVRILGYVDRPTLLSTYREAIGLLIPLRDDLRSRARFPTKLGEYLASGRPVITSSVGEIERFLEDGVTAFVAAPDDLAAFADKMIETLEDRARATRIGAAGRRVAVERFSYAPLGVRLAELIQRVCDHRPRPSGPES
jgi:glycosyltransferase involved in cell wall biosynthesis